MSGILRKTYPVALKTLDGEGEKGKVEAIVSVFGNVDLGGDRVVKGAFAKSIDAWRQSGKPVPVIFNHEWGDLWSHIGAVDSLEETEQGLKAMYTLDVDDNPAAAQVYRLMKRGSLKEHSFAYSVVREKSAKDGANELHELDIIEVGPTLKGMNPDTEVLAVKSALEQVTAAHEKTADADGAKAGRVISKANEAKLRSAMDAIAQVLSSLGSPADGEESEKSDEDEVTGKSAQDEATDKSSDPELLSLITRIQQERN
jgi:HK97 family phage prohead protease